MLTLILDELAFVVAMPEGLEATGGIRTVVLANESLEMLGGFGAVV